jgi:hypothetical protein
LSAKIPLALIFLVLTLVVCTGCQQASGEPKSEQGGRDQARAEDTKVAAEKASGVAARAGDGAETRADASTGGVDQGASSHLKARAKSTATKGSSRDSARDTTTTLEIAGDRGTRFSGTCTVGDEEREIGGRVPERFVYELDGRKLECKIRKQGSGAMNIVLDAGDADYVQRTDSGQVTARIAYSGQGFSSSIQSSTSSGSTNQTNVSQSSSTIVSSFSKNSR